MRKSVVLLEVLVISGLMVMNVHSAILGGSKQTSENCSNLFLQGSSLENSIYAVEIEYVSSTWTGATSTKWNIAANWSDGTIPNSLTDVIITSVGFHPEIDSEAICHNLTIQSGARLTIVESNILTVSGDFVNNGYFFSNNSTVIFNGNDQKVGKGPYHNLTLRGIGLKSIIPLSVAYYFGTLSMEDSASVSGAPNPGSNSFLQYNTPYKITVGPEWPSVYVWGGITIKNTGTITLNGNKALTNIAGGITYRSGLTIEENATLNLNYYNIEKPKILNLKCGGLIKGSSISGTGRLYLDNTQVNVTDAGHGTAGAMINCPIIFSGTNGLSIANDAPNVFTDNDLTISSSSGSGTLNKSGYGTLNLGTSILSLTDLKINAGNIIIPVDANITVNNEIIVTPPNGLTLESDASGTGSLIVLKGSGSATVERFMTPGRWHIVSPPISGQSISNFLGSNVSVPKGENSTRGMRDYNPGLDLWNDFFTNQTSGDLTKGKGYCMRVKTSEIHKVYFKGTLNIGDLVISGLTAGKWNCIGNPYTSAMKVNYETYTITAFLYANSANLDPLYGAIYIWEQPDASNGMSDKYTIISNATATCAIQQGQAFMVKMATGKTSINLTKGMQVHNSSLALKSTDGVWPTIKLKAMSDSVFSSTIIAFGEGMTYGLDPTYDAGLLKAENEMFLYTQLVEDAGIPFAIQALPTDYESIVVPLGIEGANVGQVNFSAELLHVPSTCQAILEDRKNNILTDLSVKDYTADLEGSNSSQGRFFLHTSYITTGINPKNRIQNLRAWAVSNREMKISGELGTKATARLFDTQGRLILSEPLKAGLNHTIGLPEIKPGLYILQVEKMQHKQALKIIIRE